MRRARRRDRPHRSLRQTRHEDEGSNPGRQGAFLRPVLNVQLFADCVVVAADSQLYEESKSDHDESDPRAVGELRHQDDQQHQGRHHEADDVHSPRAQHPASFRTVLARAQLPVPMTDHAELGQCEGDEHSDHVQLDEPGRFSLESDDKDDCR